MITVKVVVDNTRAESSCWVQTAASVVDTHELSNEERETDADGSNESTFVPRITSSC